ncbi:hypothetical protein VNO77_22897 [Canavalia gladiata]|uniref:Uncharacterized protein n=1 Tax=Canavalia gladiata TaxID=3824 RepID=A0AAN9L614_CANGL
MRRPNRTLQGAAASPTFLDAAWILALCRSQSFNDQVQEQVDPQPINLITARCMVCMTGLDSKGRLRTGDELAARRLSLLRKDSELVVSDYPSRCGVHSNVHRLLI